MAYSECSLPSSDGATLFAREWAASEPWAVVCLIHGMGDHSGRYGHVGQLFAASGITLIAADLRGHGRASGPRGHTPSYEAWLEDVERAVTFARSRQPDLPLFLYGHSAGGNLAINYAIRRAPQLAGVIAGSPWLRLAFDVPRWRLRLGRILNRLAPSAPQRTGLKPVMLTRNTRTVLEMPADGLLHDRITPRAFFALNDAGEWAMANASRLPLPLLLMHGTADSVTAIEASERFAEAAEAHCTFRPWKGYYHELHQDSQYEEPLSYVISWIGMQVHSGEEAVGDGGEQLTSGGSGDYFSEEDSWRHTGA